MFRKSILGLTGLILGIQIPQLFANRLEELEVKALTQYNDFLPKIETEVVREIQLDPNSAYAHYLLSYTYLRIYSTDPSKNSYAEKAVALAQQALELDSSSEFGYLALSDTYQALGFGDKAWAILQRIPSQSKSWRVLYRIIKNQYEIIEPSKALQLLEASAIQNPQSRNILVPLMLNLAKNFSPDKLFCTLNRIDKNIEHPLIKQEIAVHLLTKGRFRESENIFEATTKISGEDYPEIVMNYGVLLFSEFHRKEQAEKVLKETLKLAYLPRALVSTTYMYLSLIYFEKNDHIRSLESMYEALNNSSLQVETLEFIALKIIKQKPHQFTEYMNAVNSRFPGHAEFYYLLGKLYSENLGLQKEANANYANAALLEPENAASEPTISTTYLNAP